LRVPTATPGVRTIFLTYSNLHFLDRLFSCAGAGDFDRTIARNMMRGTAGGKAAGYGARPGERSGRDEEDDGGALDGGGRCCAVEWSRGGWRRRRGGVLRMLPAFWPLDDPEPMETNQRASSHFSLLPASA
jgi:hypothetical protein